jgi:hypothetical protein
MRKAPGQTLVLPIGVALVTAISVFLVPFLLPPTHPAYGQSYVVGFNNRAAILLIAAISGCVFLLGRFSGGVPQPDVDSSSSCKLRLRYLLGSSAIVLLYIGCLSAVLIRAHAHSSDDGYFLPQMEKVFVAHQQIYSQVEFVYGPLLLYPTLWIAKISHVTPSSVRVAYYVTLALSHVLGLAMLYLVVNSLNLSSTMRKVLFFSVGLFCLNPWMGLSYTLVRFLSPVFFLILLNRLAKPWPGAAFTFVTGGVAAYISPEIGIAYTLGVLAFSVAEAIRGSRLYLVEGCGVVLGVALAAWLAPPNMLSGLSHYSGGFHHVVLLPSLYLVFSLAAIVWLVPRVVAEHLRSGAQDSSVLIAMYVSSGTMIPAMFGAAECVHVLGNGTGLIILAAIYASEPFTVIYPSYHYDIDSLIVSPQFRPMYYVAEADMYDSEADQRMIRQLRQVRWAFLGSDIGPHPVGPESDNPFEFHIKFRERHPISRNVLVAEEVANHWRRVATVLPTLGLYEKVD